MEKPELHMRCRNCKREDYYTKSFKLETYTSSGPYGNFDNNGYDFKIKKPVYQCKKCGHKIPYPIKYEEAYQKMILDTITKRVKNANPFNIEFFVSNPEMREKTGQEEIICVRRHTDGAYSEDEMKERFVDYIWQIILTMRDSDGAINNELVAFARTLLISMECGSIHNEISPTYKLIPVANRHEMTIAKQSNGKYYAQDCDTNLLSGELWKLFTKRDPRFSDEDNNKDI